MGRICYIMGKSSSGKDTIFKKLKEKMPELRILIPYTTRPLRAEETDGVEYYFVDEEKQKVMEEEGRVIEVREYDTKHGIWKYFTANDGQIDLNRHSYLVIGTLESYEAMCRYFGKDKLIPVYIEVEDGLRLERALQRERGQSEPRYSEMCRRFLADEADFSEENLKKAGIGRSFRNHKIEDCLEEIHTYLKEKLK
ncbi:MAG: guanylate kinase [Ruminococcus sp.]|nr:guanylate kinase [Ruminococcus sp.]